MHTRGGVVGLDVFVKCISKYPEIVSGDAYWYAEEGSCVWAAVVDGLGSGVEAAEAARLAVASLAGDLRANAAFNASATPSDALTSMILACDFRLHNTRGAALGVAVFNAELGEGHFAGVGNIELRILNDRRNVHPVCSPGIVGAGVRKVRVERFQYAPGNLILMHSDGLSSHFDLDGCAVVSQPLEEIGEALLHAHRKADDTTLLLIRQHA